MFEENPDVTDVYNGSPAWADVIIDLLRQFSEHAGGLAGNPSVFFKGYNILSNSLISSLDVFVASARGTAWHVGREATGLIGAIGGGVDGGLVGGALGPTGNSSGWGWSGNGRVQPILIDLDGHGLRSFRAMRTSSCSIQTTPA